MTSTTSPAREDETFNLLPSLPFLLAHAAGLLVFVVEFHWWYVPLALFSYALRMFGVTAGYHRYFSHRAFKTSRWFQLVLALIAMLSAQKGVLWWAHRHRHHHLHSDTEQDLHSPARRGFWWAHVGWILCRRYDGTDLQRIPDFAGYPELVWLNRFWLVPPLSALALLYVVGGPGLALWMGILPTLFLFHGTFTINSLSHIFGSRRYLTTDTSRNNLVLALITMGEGWHNNHHYYQSSANQGFFWWEVDATFAILQVLERLGLVWELRRPPERVRLAHLAYGPAEREALERSTGFSGLRPRLPELSGGGLAGAALAQGAPSP